MLFCRVYTGMFEHNDSTDITETVFGASPHIGSAI